MKGAAQAVRARLQVTLPSRRWTGWIGRVKHRDRETDRERLEVIERLAGEARRARRTDSSVAYLERSRRWS